VLDHFEVFHHTGGSAKHHWIPIVIAGALIIALLYWTLRRRHADGAAETSAKQAR
jgi:LPXTG-motif cell wall-anchored protein